jgi:hypothetical protein
MVVSGNKSDSFSAATYSFSIKGVFPYPSTFVNDANFPNKMQLLAKVLWQKGSQ